MSHQSELISTDIDAYLAQHERKELLRLLTCGSVDDGKSTLIGRLLHDSKMIYEDQLESIKADSVKSGTTGEEVDLALLVDGLQAEREQGITIDVAYRYFSTSRRKFIIADTPGHEQYTRNMVTGASTCDLAIILIDARHGVVTQTRRHSFIAALLGIKHILVAVNKMDLVDYREDVFDSIRSDYRSFSANLSIKDVQYLPISALCGDNVVDASENMPWFRGSTLMHYLENVHIAADQNLAELRFPVQYVNRPTHDFRGYCGTIASGTIRPGDEVTVLPSRTPSTVKNIVTSDGEIEEAFAQMAVTITLTDEVDASRGDMIVGTDNLPKTDQKFEAMLVWMAEEPMVPGKQYVVKHTSKKTFGTVSTLLYRVDVNSLEREAAPTLSLNEIGRCKLTLTQPIMHDDYQRNRATGAFILIDRVTNGTVGAGMIVEQRAGDSRADHWDTEPASDKLATSASFVTPDERTARYGQKAVTVLLTGLTGAGKTTTAYALERRLFELGRACTVLDGQNMRKGISKDLGFSADERSENLRRSAEVAKLINDAGLIAICAFVAPNKIARRRAREVIGSDRFVVVHLSAPIEVCRERDQEGLYALADSGQVANFPGVSYSYEAPEKAQLVLPTHEISVTEAVDRIIALLDKREIIT
ncbi:MAG: bifunctional enzyme CysN/CysC [Phycisphaerae bacterium]|nr:MAG: bifunctional enzyme CysN/CysC [Phycisphaerae bacterium]